MPAGGRQVDDEAEQTRDQVQETLVNQQIPAMFVSSMREVSRVQPGGGGAHGGSPDPEKYI